WDVATHAPLGATLPTQSDVAPRIALSPDGNLIAFGGPNNKVELWDRRIHQISNAPIEPNMGVITSVDFSPDGKMLAVGSMIYATSSYTGTVQLWDVANRQLLGMPL